MEKSFFLFLVICQLSSCVSPKHEQGLEKDLDTLFSKYFSPNEPGGAVLVMKGKDILFEKGYGIADIKTQKPISPETVFNTGSISKTFVSNGILILKERGLLSLEDNLLKYFPDFKNKDLATKVKLINLLTHTSGLPDSRGVYHSNDSIEYYFTADDAQNFAPIKQNDTLLFQPGERFEYSNPAYNGLALIIEQLTDARWQDFIEKEIFEPAGMSDSKITDGPFPDTGVAHGYIYWDSTFQEFDYGETPTFNAAGNGGIWSTVRDLANYKIALQNATFLSEEMISESQTVFKFPNWKDSVASQKGYGWSINQTDSVKYVGHTGSQGGFRGDFQIIKDQDILYVLLCNTPPQSLLEIRTEVLAILRTHIW